MKTWSILGTSGSTRAIDYDINDQESAVADAKERIDSVEGVDERCRSRSARRQSRITRVGGWAEGTLGLAPRDCHLVGREGEVYPW